GFVAADGDYKRTLHFWRIQKWAVELRRFGSELHLFLNADLWHHFEIENTGCRDGPLDAIRRQTFCSPIMGQRHGGQVAAGRVARDVDARRITAVANDVLAHPCDGGAC